MKISDGKKQSILEIFLSVAQPVPVNIPIFVNEPRKNVSLNLGVVLAGQSKLFYVQISFTWYSKNELNNSTVICIAYSKVPLN